MNAQSPVDNKPAKSRRRLTFRRLMRKAMLPALGVVVLLAGLVWVAIHKIPGLGQALADGVRAIVGPAPVAWAENVAYAWQDRVDRWRYASDSPHTYWDVPCSTGSADTADTAGTAGTADIEAPADPDASADPLPENSVDAPALVFPPDTVTPPFQIVASPSDGTWVPVTGRAQVGGSPAMVKTMVHPDAERRYTVLAVVAMDLARVRLHVVPGTIEPRGQEMPESLRTGSIPTDDQPGLIAAFNGGFQSIHGNYAMMVDGNVVGEAQSDSCTIGLYRDGAIRIRSWDAIGSEVERMQAYRQTPRCIIENGVRHPDLENRYNTSWGAVVDKGTVIRRSALGISEDGRTLYFGMGDSLTARSLADGMKAIGAHDVAQLDVNHVYPRFVFFGERTKGKLVAIEPLCPGFNFSSNDYVNAPMMRDFFYVTSATPQ